MNRRRFLRLGIGGAVVLVAGGGVLRWVAMGYAEQLGPGEIPVALSIKELAIVKAFVATLLPEVDGFPSGLALGVHQRIDEEVWSASDGTRRDVKNGLQLFEHATLLHGHRARFTSLDLAAREAYVRALLAGEPGALQQVAFGLKEMAYLFYYCRPETWTRIGYEGPFVAEAKPPESHVGYQALLAKRRG